jgi:hypothetical protein
MPACMLGQARLILRLVFGVVNVGDRGRIDGEGQRLLSWNDAGIGRERRPIGRWDIIFTYLCLKRNSHIVLHVDASVNYRQASVDLIGACQN